jgi:hypothetical protein
VPFAVHLDLNPHGAAALTLLIEAVERADSDAVTPRRLGSRRTSRSPSTVASSRPALQMNCEQTGNNADSWDELRRVDP